MYIIFIDEFNSSLRSLTAHEIKCMVYSTKLNSLLIFVSSNYDFINNNNNNNTFNYDDENDEKILKLYKLKFYRNKNKKSKWTELNCKLPIIQNTNNKNESINLCSLDFSYSRIGK